MIRVTILLGTSLFSLLIFGICMLFMRNVELERALIKDAKAMAMATVVMNKLLIRLDDAESAIEEFDQKSSMDDKPEHKVLEL